jgi:predicted CXXCH cytochrome family protein
MRKILVTIAFLFFSGNVLADIAGSAHDFNFFTKWQATGNGADQRCAYCHTPHSSNVATQPLWNKATLTAVSYTAYGETTSGTTIGTTGVPTGTTQLCLGCHDGTVAAGEVSNPPNVGWGDNSTKILPADSTYQDNTFANDHPVGFDYTLSTANPAVTAGLLADPTAAGLPLNAANDFMECSTCHDVHSENDYPTLLRLDNTASAMCTTCHITK